MPVWRFPEEKVRKAWVNALRRVLAIAFCYVSIVQYRLYWRLHILYKLSLVGNSSYEKTLNPQYRETLKPASNCKVGFLVSCRWDVQGDRLHI